MKEELAPPDCRVRAGPRQTDAEREGRARSNTRTVQRLVHILYDGQRTHPVTTSPNKRVRIIREGHTCDGLPLHVADVKAVVNAQTVSGESVTCVAVKEDRHQNIMSSAALKKGVEEPWTLERVVRFIDLHVYRWITLKSDTDQQSLRSEKPCGRNVQSRSRKKRVQRKETRRRTGIENTVMLLRVITRTIECHIESGTQAALREDWRVPPWFVEHAGSILRRCDSESRRENTI